MLTARKVYETIVGMNGTQGALACALSPIGVTAQTAHGLSEEQIAELKEWVPLKVQVLEKLPDGWRPKVVDIP